jgi:CheY-like chemotaxis protein/HPt (histidine-containing phosphotransfer) domain-containing protein
LIVFALMSSDISPVRVLVVDDDEVSREVLAVLLTGEGHLVETAESGDAALASLSDNGSAKPDVVLVDMQMPGTSGAALATRLREICGAGTMLLAMSGSEPASETVREFDGFLQKPFTMKDVASAITGRAFVVADAPSTGAALILDEAVYEKLERSMKSSQLEQLYTMCLTDAEKRVAEMRQAAAAGDDPAYRSAAHAIKGGCGMVGAVELQTLATSMENKGLGANHVASLDEFMMASERLRRILVARKET